MTRPSSIAITARARDGRGRADQLGVERVAPASDAGSGMRSGVTGLEHRAQLVVQLREGLGAGLERLVLDDAQPGDAARSARRRESRMLRGSSVSLMGYEYSPGSTSSA